MPIDNFDLIRPLLHFEMKGDLYFAEVIQRGKDLGKSGERLIRDYRIHSIEHFDTLKEEIVDLCEHFHARCYLRLNLRNSHELNKYLMIEMLQQELNYERALRHYIRNGCTKQDYERLPQISSAPKLYGSVLGQHSSEDRNTKKWIIDVDQEPDRTLEEVHESYRSTIETVGGHIYTTIPSKTGQHIITSPFDVQKFSKILGTSKPINKDGNTNLYIGD